MMKMRKKSRRITMRKKKMREKMDNSWHKLMETVSN
jgi:hypothetical protein